MKTSITIRFNVNDLSADYYVNVSSKAFKVEKSLGRGSDLVKSVGEKCSQIIDLDGNYGFFDVRIFALSNLGVKSNTISGRVEVQPPRFNKTFYFADISLNNKELNSKKTITQQPLDGEGLLSVDSNFISRYASFNWSLFAPSGHRLEGEQVQRSLLEDTFFSGFNLRLKNNQQYINLDEINFERDLVYDLTNKHINTNANLGNLFSNYSGFSLNITESIFDRLDLSRNISLEIVSVDKFGGTSTGIINLSNPEPEINVFDYELNGTQASFNWGSNDLDFVNVSTDILAVPRGTRLPYSNNLDLNAQYFQSLKNSKQYNSYKNAKYRLGDRVKYKGDVYSCISGHQRSSDEYPETGVIVATGVFQVTGEDGGVTDQTGYADLSKWNYLGPEIDFEYFSSRSDVETQNLIENSSSISLREYGNKGFSVSQLIGWDYYYSFESNDEFGVGKTYNLTSNGLIEKNIENFIQTGSIYEEEFSAVDSFALSPLAADIQISDLVYREIKDNFVFNWETRDQGGKNVDLSQNKFIFGEGDSPSLLGISGSLYDIDTKYKITGITEGYNSKSIDFDDEGDLVVNYNLPSAKVFDQYQYTRQLNNSIYNTGNIASSVEIYDSGKNYVSGDNVIVGGKIFESKLDSYVQIGQDNINIYPQNNVWKNSSEETLNSGQSFLYQGSLYFVNDDFGPDIDSFSGIYEKEKIYNSGDIVASPKLEIDAYNNSNTYSPGDFVFYEGSIYECSQDIASGEGIHPDFIYYWSRANLFEDVGVDYFESISGSNQGNLISDTGYWRKINPSYLSSQGKFFDFKIPEYEYAINNWESGVYFNSGSLALYDNDIWLSENLNVNQIPSGGSEYWSNNGDFGLHSEYYGRNYSSGDLVVANNSVYKCIADNPSGAPIHALDGIGESFLSNYYDSHWVPFWEQQNNTIDNIALSNPGIPQSGKRGIGLEVGIVDKRGKILNLKKIEAVNPPPKIINSGFNVDSVSEATKVKFNFNYDQGFQEKTTKVYLYRSSEPNFDIVDELGFPLTGEDSPFVKSVLGAGDATFGQNITTLIDTPPIPEISGVDQITGYYYKILPFDDFGSGVLHSVPTGVSEKVIVYPKRYSSSNKNAVPGEILRSDPTGVDGPVPNQVENLSGFTSFEGFTLTWNAPGISGRNYEAEKISWSNNDIDYYEIWASTGEYIQTGLDAASAINLSKGENIGFRKIDGEFYSVSQSGITPTESIDVANYILNADNVLNVPASTPSIEAIYPGKTNESKNFWVRSVDFAGNKSKFSEFSEDPAEVKGLSLSLSKASALDMKDFEVNMTEGFSRTISLLPNNPFSINETTNEISWGQHYLYNQGTGYIVSGNSTNDSFIWWDKNDSSGNLNLHDYYVKTQDNIIEKYDSHDLSNLSEFDVILGQPLRNVYFSGVDYKTSVIHPANNESLDDIESTQNGFDDDDFIVARNLSGSVEPVNVSFTKALIGTANIASAAIKTSHVSNLSADKITAGEIKSADIQVGTGVDGSAVLRSAGFSGVNSQLDNTGFFLSGDGSFGFQAGDSSLSFEGETLTLRGKLRQTNNFDYDFIDLNASVNMFNYIEAKGYENGSPWVDTFLPDDNSPSVIDITAVFRNSSVPQTGIRFKMDVASGDNVHSVFGYEDYNAVDGSYSISGFNYYPDFDFEANGDTKIVRAAFDLGERSTSVGFDDIIDRAFDGFGLADSVLISVSGINSTFEKSVSIGRVNDGKVGERGLTPTYRGVWNNSTSYVFIDSQDGQPGRGDIVEFPKNHPDRINQGDSINSNYFISIETASNQLPIIGGQLNSFYWREFGAELESVATNLLLTKEAFITEKLTMGVGGNSTQIPHSGIIVSSDFTGGLLDVNSEPYLPPATEEYNTPGFLLARTDDGVVFDVGGTGVLGNDSYLRFDSKSGKIEIAGSFINNTVIDPNLFYTGTFADFQDGDNLTSFIGGGYNNEFVVGPEGDKYYENLGSAILGGGWNTMSSRFSAIAGGYSGHLADNFSFIGGGFGNKMPLEEPGDHQGANFIGGGIENIISGGASQSIVNGIENKINQSEGVYLNNQSVQFDEDQGWFSSKFLGDGQTVTFDPVRTGWASGVNFPATTNYNWGVSESGYWENELQVGYLEGINKGGWVYYSELDWFYFPPPPDSDIYSDNNWTPDWVYSNTYKDWMFWIGGVDEDQLVNAFHTSTGWFEMRMNRTGTPIVEVKKFGSPNWGTWGDPIQ